MSTARSFEVSMPKIILRSWELESSRRFCGKRKSSVNFFSLFADVAIMQTRGFLRPISIAVLVALAGASTAARADIDISQFSLCVRLGVTKSLGLPAPQFVEIKLDGVSDFLPKVLVSSDDHAPKDLRDFVRQTKRPLYEWIGRVSGYHPSECVGSKF